MRAAVVDVQTNIVENIIVADADRDAAPAGYFLVNLDDTTGCNLGWVYDPIAQSFSDPSPAAGE